MATGTTAKLPSFETRARARSSGRRPNCFTGCSGRGLFISSRFFAGDDTTVSAAPSSSRGGSREFSCACEIDPTVHRGVGRREQLGNHVVADGDRIALVAGLQEE